MDALLTVEEIPANPKVHPNTVYEMAKNGEIPSNQIHGFRESASQDLLKAEGFIEIPF